MLFQMKVQLYHSHKKTNAKGLAPIYLRLVMDGARKEISTGISVAKVHFNGTSVIKETDANNKNAVLQNIIADFNSIIYEHNINRIKYNVQSIMTAYLNKNQKHLTLMQLIAHYDIDRQKQNNICIDTIKSDANKKTILATYLKHSRQEHVALFNLNNAWGNNFVNYLHTITQANGELYSKNTINKFKFYLTSLVKYAVSKDYINHNVMEQLQKIETKRKTIVNLDYTEFQRWETYRFASDKLQRVADAFTFQCYTGFDYGCLCTFDYQAHTHLNKNIVVINKPRSKNGQIATIPLEPKALALLQKHNYKLPIISGQKYNLYLRECAEVIGIHKHLTSHVARKTFTNTCINVKMYSVEAVSKMLGHSTTLMLQKHYGNPNEDRVLAEYQMLHNTKL
jgi:integrase/recombinase XerD